MLFFHSLLLPTIGQYGTLQTPPPSKPKEEKEIDIEISDVLFTSHVLKPVKSKKKKKKKKKKNLAHILREFLSVKSRSS